MMRHTAHEIGATLTHRLAIDELNAWVASCLDLQSYTEMADAFTADAQYVSGPRVLNGPQDIVDFFVHRKKQGGPRSTRHMGSGLRLKFDASGRLAQGSSVWISYASNTEVPVDTLAAFMVADFDDTYVLEDDGYWRICKRVITPVFKNVEAAPRS